MEAAGSIEQGALGQVLHPTRLAIIATMGNEEMAPVDVATKLGYSRRELGAIAYHFRCMHEHNILRVVRTEPVRGSTKTYYALQPNVLKRARRELARTLEQLEAALGDG